MHEHSSKSSDSSLPVQQVIEMGELRMRVKTMAKLLCDCKEVISQNVQERNVLLERIKYLENKSKTGIVPNTEANESKFIDKAKRYKSKINKFRKFVKKQKRDLRLARYLNRRLFEHYLQLFQCIKNCQNCEKILKSESPLPRLQSREVITKSEDSEDSLVIPESIKDVIWNKKRPNSNNKGSHEKLCRNGDNLGSKQEKDACLHQMDLQRPKSRGSKFGSEDEVKDDPQSEVSLPQTPSSPLLELFNHRTSKCAPSMSQADLNILKSLNTQQKMADKQMDALHRFHDALKSIKKHHKREST